MAGKQGRAHTNWIPRSRSRGWPLQLPAYIVLMCNSRGFGHRTSDFILGSVAPSREDSVARGCHFNMTSLYVLIFWLLFPYSYYICECLYNYYLIRALHFFLQQIHHRFRYQNAALWDSCTSIFTRISQNYARRGRREERCKNLAFFIFK